MLLTVEQLQSISHFGEVPCQGDIISSFLFVLASEALFILIKSKPEIEGMITTTFTLLMLMIQPFSHKILFL